MEWHALHQRDEDQAVRQQRLTQDQNDYLAQLKAQNDQHLAAAEDWRKVERDHMKVCAKRYEALTGGAPVSDQPTRH